MKILSFLILVSLLFGLTTLACAEDQSGYNSRHKYPGIYKSDRLYQLDNKESVWYGSKRPKQLHNLQCDEAIRRLRAKGSWTGNLSDQGKCLGTSEAPTWATGNYLNYLNGGDAAKQSNQE